MQMFEVALSRRICCSRVESGQHEAALALGIDRLAAEPARHLAHIFLAARRTGRHRARRNSARCRSTGPRRRRCRRPCRPGGVTAGRARPTSVNTAISSAPSGMGLLGDRRGGRAGCRTRRATARRRRRRRRRSAARMSSAASASGASAIDSYSGHLRPTGSRSPRYNADAGRRRAPPCARRGDAMRHQHRLAARGRAVIHRGVRRPPCRSAAATWVWNSNRYCSVPWAISGW